MRETGTHLRDILAADPEIAARLPPEDLDRAFDPGPAVRAASGWIDRVAAETARVRAALSPDRYDGSGEP